MAGFRGVRGKVNRRMMWPAWWRRHPFMSLGILALLLLVAYSRLTTPLGNDHDRYHNREFLCVHVVDGDTLDIAARDGRRQRTRIRLCGLDTPETARSDRSAMYYGEEAAAFTRGWAENRMVRVELAPMQTRDVYGRLLAYVYRPDDGEMLNEALIRGGFAYADVRFAHVRQSRFADLEKQARKQGAGLWKSVTSEQMPAWRQRYEQRRESQPTPPTP